MDRQRRVEKENRIKTLGTERCEKIKTLYINELLLILLLKRSDKRKIEAAEMRFLRQMAGYGTKKKYRHKRTVGHF